MVIEIQTAKEFREDTIKSLKEKRTELQDELNEIEEYVIEHADELKKSNDLRARLRDRFKDSTIFFPDKSIFEDKLDKEIQKLRRQIFYVDENIKKWEIITVEEIYKDPSFNFDKDIEIFEISKEEKEKNEKRKSQFIDENKPKDWHSGNN